MDYTIGPQVADALDDHNLGYLTYVDSTPYALCLDGKLKRPDFSDRVFFSGGTQPSTGLLGLPTELLDKIIANLDIDSFLNLRLVSRNAAKTVDDSPEYRTILKYAPNTLRGICSIDTGAFITIKSLHEALYTTVCSECGELAGYLNLLTLQRFCLCCIKCNERHRLLTAAQARCRWNLDECVFNTLPLAKIDLESKESYAHPQTAYEAAIAIHGSHEKMLLTIAKRLQEHSYDNHENHQSETALQQKLLKDYKERVQRSLEALRQCSNHGPPDTRGDDDVLADDIDFAPFVRVPFVDKVTKKMEWGYQCFGCKVFEAWPYNKHRLYTRETFERHLRNDLGVSGVSTAGMVHGWRLRKMLRVANKDK